MADIITQETIERRILVLRGKKVMLDKDLAGMYGVKTTILKRAVKRNLERFPDDFVFRMTEQEMGNLRIQIGSSRKTHGGSRYLPYAFTETGVAMLSSVLNSKHAINLLERKSRLTGYRGFISLYFSKDFNSHGR